MSSENDPIPSLLARLREERIELVRVIGPSDRDDPCLDWVGAVLSVSGRTPNVPSLAQAMADGLFHAGCRHTLVAFNPRTVSAKRLEDAEACTRHAMAAMAARQRGKEPPYLSARYELRQEAERRGATSGNHAAMVTPRVKFARVYEAARKAEAAGDAATALVKCRAALDLLQEHDFFGTSQTLLVEALGASIRRLQGPC